MLHKLYILTLSVLITFCLSADSSRKEVVSAALEFDALYGVVSCHALFEVEVIRPGSTRHMKMELWGEGHRRTFVRVLEDEKYKGVSTLVINKNIWLCLPADGGIVKIKPEKFNQVVMETDFKYIDMVREFSLASDFIFSSYLPENPETDMEYVKCVPRNTELHELGYMLICYDKKQSVAVWLKMYGKNGDLTRTMTYSDIRNKEGRNVPFAMRIDPADKKGYSTIVRYISLDFNPTLPESIFSMKNLRKSIN